MYALIKQEQLKGKGFYETLPDGRIILPFSELKMMGSVSDIDVISSARELKGLIKKQKESGLYDKPVEGGEVTEPDSSIVLQPEENTSDLEAGEAEELPAVDVLESEQILESDTESN